MLYRVGVAQNGRKHVRSHRPGRRCHALPRPRITSTTHLNGHVGPRVHVHPINNVCTNGVFDVSDVVAQGRCGVKPGVVPGSTRRRTRRRDPDADRVLGLGGRLAGDVFKTRRACSPVGIAARHGTVGDFAVQNLVAVSRRVGAGLGGHHKGQEKEGENGAHTVFYLDNVDIV